MDASVLDAAGHALVMIMQPHTLMFLALGVVIGLAIGLLPGMNGVAGMALLLPFTYNMDAYTALAFLLGLGSVVTTSDVLPAILFGVPGQSSAQSTVLDGYPMARRGEAGRALSAAYMSALLGGLFGAAVLGLTIPVLRPVMLYIGSPELLAFALFGVSMVAVLSGSTPLRGMAAAGFGIVLAMIGGDPQGGELRWTLGSLYLWDGLALLPVALGLFAVPALCDLAITRTAIAGGPQLGVARGMIDGAKDAFRNWWLIVRCGGVGAGIGAIPGLGHAVIGWLAYAHAMRTEKGAMETFGKGDVRGLIASEAANNAKEGGGLVPTVAFGVPAGASMAILLGAFLIHGLIPGPEMLTTHLDVTYSMVWSVALANIMGSALCYLFSGYFAKLTTLRYTLILPGVLVIVFIGAFQGKRDWGDLYTLLAFGMLGWTMRRLKWPRPPLVLGFVLGEIIERYMFISVGRYGWAWLTHPIVIGILAFAVIGFIRPFAEEVKSHGGLKKMFTGFGRPRFKASELFPAGLILLLLVMMIDARQWGPDARIVPEIVGWATIVIAGISLANQLFRLPALARAEEQASIEGEAKQEIAQRVRLDFEADVSHLTAAEVLRRAAIFFGWFLLFLASMALIGVILTVPLFTIAYMRAERREPWRLTIGAAAILALFVYGVFDVILAVPWPRSLLGEMVPALRAFPSV